MKMINNYLDTLEGYLPEESQEEIREEFESSLMDQIEDKQQQLGRDLDEDEQETLLLKIGHPLRVASAYLPNQELINKDYFPAYKRALKISLSIFAVITLLAVLPYKLGTMGAIGMIQFLFSTAISVADVGLTVFLYVTGIFYLMQRYNFSLDSLYAWSPKKLSSSGKKISLSRFEVFFEMAFEAQFLVIWNYMFLSEYVMFENNFIENFSMSADWSSVFIPMNIVVGASFMLNIFKITRAYWSRKLLVSNIILNMAGVIVLVYILQFDSFFNLSSLEIGDHNWEKINYYAELNLRIVIGFVIGITILDSYSHFKKLGKTT